MNYLLISLTFLEPSERIFYIIFFIKINLEKSFAKSLVSDMRVSLESVYNLNRAEKLLTILDMMREYTNTQENNAVGITIEIEELKRRLKMLGYPNDFIKKHTSFNRSKNIFASCKSLINGFF